MTIEERLTLGRKLRELRCHPSDRDYRTLHEAAKAAGVSFVEWSHYEQDRERPSREFLRHIVPLFSADLDELLRLWDEWVEASPPDLTRSICQGRRREGRG